MSGWFPPPPPPPPSDDYDFTKTTTIDVNVDFDFDGTVDLAVNKDYNVDTTGIYLNEGENVVSILGSVEAVGSDTTFAELIFDATSTDNSSLISIEGLGITS